MSEVMEPWVVFEVGSARLAIPAAQVDRVIPRPVLVRLPSLTAAADAQGHLANAVHVGNEIVPLIGRAQLLLQSGAEADGDAGPATQARAAEVLVLETQDGRIALEVDRVLAVGAPSSDRGPVRPVDAGQFRGIAPPRAAPPVASARRPGLGPRIPAPTEAAARVLVVEAGALFRIGAADVVSVHGPAAMAPVPRAGPGLLGATMLQGQALPVLSADGAARPGSLLAFVVVRCAAGDVAVAVEHIVGWATRDEAAGPVLRPETLRADAGLRPAPAQDRPARPPGAELRLLPVTIGRHQYGLRMDHVERLIAPGQVTQLPTGGTRHARLDGAVAVDGRVVPVTDGGRWVGVETDGAERVHVLVRPLRERHILVVTGVGRPFAFDAALLQPLLDPDRRIGALARLPGGTLPVLDLATLDPAVGAAADARPGAP